MTISSTYWCFGLCMIGCQCSAQTARILTTNHWVSFPGCQIFDKNKSQLSFLGCFLSFWMSTALSKLQLITEFVLYVHVRHYTSWHYHQHSIIVLTGVYHFITITPESGGDKSLVFPILASMIHILLFCSIHSNLYKVSTKSECEEGKKE